MFDLRRRLSGTQLDYYSLPEAERAGLGAIGRLPMTVKVLLEMLLRGAEQDDRSEANVRPLAAWPTPPPSAAELPFIPARALLQDLTGVPAVVALAAMRSAMQQADRDASRIDPQIPVDLVIDHSVQVDVFGTPHAYQDNVGR